MFNVIFPITALAQPPYVTASAASNVTQTSAALYGYVNYNYGNKITSQDIDFRIAGGTWSTVYKKTPTNTEDREIKYTKTGLSAGTTYEYRAWAINNLGEYNNSVTISFKTNSASTYTFTPDPTGTYTFPAANEGYGAQTAKTAAVKNTGNQSGTNFGSKTFNVSFTVNASVPPYSIAKMQAYANDTPAITMALSVHNLYQTV